MILTIGFMLVVTRIASAMLAAPILGHRSVPFYMRIVLSIVIAVAVAPTIFDDEKSFNAISGVETEGIFSSIIAEVITGSMIGLGILIIYSAASMIGSAIGQLSGIQLDTFGGSETGFGQHPTSKLVGIVAAAVFVLAGGPELVLTTVIDSFFALPVGQPFGENNALNLVTTLLHQSFELTVRAIAPAVATLLIATILVGMLSRTMPQLNLIQVGLSSNLGIMYVAIFLTLGGFAWLVVDDVERASQFINQSFNLVRVSSAN